MRNMPTIPPTARNVFLLAVAALLTLAVPSSASEEKIAGVFGTSIYVYKGTSERETHTFSVPALVHGPFKLVAHNEIGGIRMAPKRVLSGRVRLNGVEILGPSELNEKVESVERGVSLLPENVLEIDISGPAGASLWVGIEVSSTPSELWPRPHTR